MTIKHIFPLITAMQNNFSSHIILILEFYKSSMILCIKNIT